MVLLALCLVAVVSLLFNVEEARSQDVSSLSERIYATDNQVVTVVREYWRRTSATEFDAIRQTKVYVDRSLSKQRVEQFGIFNIGNDQSATYSTVLPEGAESTIVSSMNQTFAAAAVSSSSRPEYTFVYDGSSPSNNQGELNNAMERSARQWRGLAEQDFAQRQSELRRRELVITEQRKLQVELKERTLVMQGQAALGVAEGLKASTDLMAQIVAPGSSAPLSFP